MVMPDIPTPAVSQAMIDKILSLFGGAPSAGGGGGLSAFMDSLSPRATSAPSAAPSPAQGAPDEKIVAEFRAIAEAGASAHQIQEFLQKYGRSMDAPTWSAIYRIAQEMPRQTGLPGPETGAKVGGALGIVGGPVGAALGAATGALAGQASDVLLGSDVDADYMKASLQQGGVENTTLLLDEPATLETLPEAVSRWVKSPLGRRALGVAAADDVDKLLEQQKNLDALLDQAAAEGRSASEIEELRNTKTPLGFIAQAVENPEYLLQFNPHLAGMETIPAGTPIFLGPRSTLPQQGETLQKIAERLGVPVESLVAYNQREYQLRGGRFDPDSIDPGEEIFIPPPGAQPEALASPEQTAQPPGTVPWKPGVGPMGPEPVVPGTVPLEGDPYLAGLYETGGLDALYSAIIGSKNYAAPYGQYLKSKLPQVMTALDMQSLVDTTPDLTPLPDKIAEVLKGLEGGQMPNVDAIMQQMTTSPEYRAYEGELGGLSEVAQLLAAMRGNTLTQADASLYNNPEYIGMKIADYLKLYPSGSTNAPTFFEYLVQKGM